jgi:hypothetical protein
MGMRKTAESRVSFSGTVNIDFFAMINSKNCEIGGICSKYERICNTIQNCTVIRITANVCLKTANLQLVNI